MELHDRPHVTRLVQAKEIRGLGGGAFAEQCLDRLHGLDDAVLRGGGEAVQHPAHVLVRAGVEGREGLAPLRGQREVASPAVLLRTELAKEPALLEAAQDAAQIPGVDAEVATQLGGRRVHAVRELVQHARLREGERTAGEAFTQHADLARVEAVEATHGVDAAIEVRHTGNNQPDD